MKLTGRRNGRVRRHSERKERRPELPVMMVTAYGDDERQLCAAEYGAAEFLTKPVDADR
jgi:DNA-binding NtrC family response regulator